MQCQRVLVRPEPARWSSWWSLREFHTRLSLLEQVAAGRRPGRHLPDSFPGRPSGRTGQASVKRTRPVRSAHPSRLLGSGGGAG
jgi:hypothetical protein